jgi:uracil-DNA glycosylase
MSERRLRYLAEIGIPAYALRGTPDVSREVGDDSAARPVVPAGGTAVDAWSALEAEVRDCTRCALHRGRTQTVFGVGRRNASLLVVGEAPGEEEDRQGEPFVGPAGRLLNAMLRAIGLSREEVFIANILKCRPPRNRDPSPEEADACSSFLDRQIAMIEPRAMLAVGRISAQRLLATEQPVGKLRGVVHRYGDTAIPLVVTYHPAYLLRTPSAKAKSWQDLCMLMPLLASSAE